MTFLNNLGQRAGQRTNTSPVNAAGWIVAIGMLAFIVPASSALAPNVLFFTSHDVGFLAGVLVIVATGAISWLIWWAILRATKATPQRFDRVASIITFVVASFAVANIIGHTLLPEVPSLAWILGIIIGAVITQLTRKASVGTGLAVIGTAAAVAPLVLAMVSQAPLSPTAAATFASDQRPDVVWVIADELSYTLAMRPDGTVRDEFPNMKALQETATTYSRAYTPANYTDFAVPALFNGHTDLSKLNTDEISAMKQSRGIIPALSRDYAVVMESPLFTFACSSADCKNAAPLPSDGPIGTGATLVADMAAVVGRTSLAEPASLLFPDLRGKWRDFWASGPLARSLVIPAQRVVDRIERVTTEDPSAPVLTFWHTMRTHAPWNVDGEGKTTTPLVTPILPGSHLVGSDADGHFSTEELKTLGRQMYTDAAREFDRELGVLITGLKEQGRYDNTMIIVMADHGVTVNSMQDRRLGDTEVAMWSEVAHVPLIIKSPGQTQPALVTEPRSTGQIAATVMQALKADAPGTAAAPALDQAPESIVFSHAGVSPMRNFQFPNVTEADPWTSEMLAGTDPVAATNAPTGVVADAVLTTLVGVSSEAFVAIDNAPMGCITNAALLDGDGKAWRAWFTKDGSRGWSVVPRAGQYRLYCS